MTQPELPDMGDPLPRDGLPDWKVRFYQRAMAVLGLGAPWVFLWVAVRRNPGLWWIPVLTLLGTYAGLFVIVRNWRDQFRRACVALAGVVACWLVCGELFRQLN
ncbi:hypothetical protein FCH28_26015 [Streptomyces piniterrae]|uniref:Uncharacterized protein n=1 Tax=Streptomyces piniterrae TaxID=2571125 RepID=A0A4U0MY67_9ACTN|nr:hypothetical protein [Streptomyces piniterrae]TJZ45993.1 hypothetical protein FCH28_26015 [Streptomyces piniterrae]